jgi:hypothetical protein
MKQYEFRRARRDIARLVAADKEPIDERGTITVAKLSFKKYMELEEEMKRQEELRLAQEIMIRYS